MPVPTKRWIHTKKNRNYFNICSILLGMILTKKKIIVGILILGIGGAIYYFGRSEEIPEQTETVRRGDVVEMVSVTGELVPTEYANLSFQSTGVIDAVFVKEGEMVTVGKKIASLDRSVLWSQLKEARLAAAIVEQEEKLSRHGWDDLK